MSSAYLVTDVASLRELHDFPLTVRGYEQALLMASTLARSSQRKRSTTMIVCCKECGAQIIMTAHGVWRTDVPSLHLNGAVYFCTIRCRDTYAKKHLR
jgi:hypothetical protein